MVLYSLYMSSEIEREILGYKSSADRMLEKTALELEILLQEACTALRPFPSFPNAFFTNAIECDPNGQIGNGDHGCIVVTDNGELQELDFGVDHEAVEMLGSWDPVSSRKETLKPLDLHPRDYILFAYSGLTAVTEALLEKNSPAQIIPEKSEKNPPTAEHQTQTADSLVEEGNVYFTVGQYNLALDRYTSALEQKPQDVNALYNRGRANSRLGALEDALADYNQVLNLKPEDLDTLNNRGLLYMQKEEIDKALEDFETALLSDGTDTALLINKGLALLKKGENQNSLLSFQQAIEHDPEDSAAHFGTAKAFIALNNRDEALQALQTTFNLDASYIEEAFEDPSFSQLANDSDFLDIIKVIIPNFRIIGEKK